VRLFEAAACGVPIISDCWKGLDTLFQPGSEILISESARETIHYLVDVPERERRAIGRRARRRVLAEHTAEHRAVQHEQYLAEAAGAPVRRRRSTVVQPATQPGVAPLE
jgi:spore maturation protein CgeB